MGKLTCSKHGFGRDAIEEQYDNCDNTAAFADLHCAATMEKSFNRFSEISRYNN